MESQKYFSVIQSSEAPTGANSNTYQTIYPEIHYVFADDAFSPETDAVERRPGDISVLVDLDSSGQEILGCQSISPEWQVTDASLVPQALEATSVNAKPQHNSRLLKVTGTPARRNQDIVSFQGNFESQVAKGLSLIEQLENRQRELRKAVSSFPDHESDA